MMTKEGSTKILNFMTPEAGVLALGSGHISHISYIVKMHYFFKKNLLLFSQAWIRQIKYLVMITKKGFTQGWGSDVRAWPYKSL